MDMGEGPSKKKIKRKKVDKGMKRDASKIVENVSGNVGKNVEEDEENEA